jgi:hypothetical protein
LLRLEFHMAVSGYFILPGSSNKIIWKP